MNRERALKLLATDLTYTQVASILGVSPGRISQLLAEPEFKERLEAERLLVKTENIEQTNLENKHLSVEHAILNHIQENLPSAEFRDAVVALRVVSDIRLRNKVHVNPILGSQPVINNIVQIALPNHAVPAPTIQLSSTNEVIAIGERTLAPLSSKGVVNLFNKLDGKETKDEPATTLASTEASTQEFIPAPRKEIALGLANAAKQFLASFTKGEVNAAA